MAKVVLYPYRRFQAADVTWNDWVASLDGRVVRIEEVADSWDPKTQLRFSMEASIRSVSLESIGGGRPKLVLTAASHDCASTFSASTDFITSGESLTAGTEVVVPGNAIAQSLELNARILLAVPGPSGTKTLSRRIVSEIPSTRVALDSTVEGFPTSAYSFEKHKLPEAPWRLAISAEDLESPFSHSVRLHLNEDYAAVRGLIDGSPKKHVEQELTATIARVLIGTVARLAADDAQNRSLDAVAAEFPDSLAAGAQVAANRYLRKSLDAAASDYRKRPEGFEYAIYGGVGSLKGT
ncbi:hypothetical protein [Brevibacterium sp. W7.2]|uniref:hypothetical protein n=1 Tax=Brevibacterium sp. W7.2 TaxID=2823518 RepID=UPI001BAE5105|nr:hypothetical protein [Brevibacterium sp. W7.2]